MLREGLVRKRCDLRNRILRDKYHVSRPKMRIFLQTFLLQHLLQIEQPSFHQIVIHSPEQHDL